MPLKHLPAKSVTANTWAQLGAAYPDVPGTLILGGTSYISVGFDGTDATTAVLQDTAALPMTVYVDSIRNLYVKSGATTIYLGYYPATENPPAVR